MEYFPVCCCISPYYETSGYIIFMISGPNDFLWRRWGEAIFNIWIQGITIMPTSLISSLGKFVIAIFLGDLGLILSFQKCKIITSQRSTTTPCSHLYRSSTQCSTTARFRVVCGLVDLCCLRALSAGKQQTRQRG